MRHEQHEYIAVGVAGGERNPHFAVRRHRRDDVDLLAQRLVGCRVQHSPPLPASLAEVGCRNPALVDVDDSLRGLVHLEHLLGVEASQHLVALGVASEGNALDLPV